MAKDTRLAEVLFEFRHLGNSVQVNAIDPDTGTEVSMVGDPRAGEHVLKQAAMRKLAFVLAKRRAAGQDDA